MIKVEINNSKCVITGLDKEHFKALKQLMSYKINDQASFHTRKYHSNASPIRYLLSNNGSFPTGLLYLLDIFSSVYKLNIIKEDLRVKPNSIKNTFHLRLNVTPYIEQTQAAEACQNRHRGMVVAPTGVGKSVMVALTIGKVQVPTLVVVPTLELQKQLTQTLTNAFPNAKVGHLGADIAVLNVDALKADQSFKKYDCVIIDEFHHSGAKTYRSLNHNCWNTIYYKFGFTATPFRSNEDERLLLESVLSEVIYEIPYSHAVKQKYIVPMQAFYITVPKTKLDKTYKTWLQVYSQLVVHNELRNKIISDLIASLDTAGISNLCLVKEIAHGESLKATINATSGSLKPIEFANGQADNSRQLILEFILGERKSLIGTTGILAEGVDTKPAQFVIIGGLGKSRNAFMQQVGRSFRTSPGKEIATVVIFKDTSHKWTLNHFNEQCKILREEYNVEATEFFLD